MLNKFVLYTFILLFSFHSYSQKEDWLAGGEILELAIKANKPIMANFTGSDWCGWCIRLDKAVFQTEEFKEWAKENVILLELDFPRRKKLDANLQAFNDQLQQQFQVRGFPTIWVFSVSKTKDGKYSINANLSNPFQKMSYMPSATDFINKASDIIVKMEEIYNQEYSKSEFDTEKYKDKPKKPSF